MAGKTATDATDVIITGDDSNVINVDNPVPADDGFTETSELPSGRKARQIPPVVLAKLEESASRNVGFSKTATKREIDELRKDLASAAVKARFDVTTGSKDAGKGLVTLTFSATFKPAE
jgi:hypothetical protein